MSKELIEQLRLHDDERLYQEADVLMSEAADLIEAQQEQIRHLQMSLADTEALEIGTSERLAAAQKRIELYEKALLASWPDGAVGAAFDYWNAARKDRK